MTPRFGLILVCGLLAVPSVGRAEEASFDSNGVKLHYYIAGKGEPVLLLHGFAFNVQYHWLLTGVFKTLAKDHRVIALDIRGHGQSDKPTKVEQYGLEMVEDVVRLFDHLKIEKAHVVGYSMGSLITGKLLATHPDRVLSATLGGSGIYPTGVKLPSFFDNMPDSLEKGKGVGLLSASLTPAWKRKLSASDIQALDRIFVADHGKALAASLRSWKTLSVPWKQLKANKVPTLALIGENDPLKESVDRIKDDMGNLKVVVIKDTDHLNAVISPKFIGGLSQFLEKHRQKTPAQVP